MFRTLLPLARRTLPTVAKVTAVTFAMFLLQKKQLLGSLPIFTSSTKCFHISFVPNNAIGEVLSRVIRVELNGEFVGYAYSLT